MVIVIVMNVACLTCNADTLLTYYKTVEIRPYVDVIPESDIKKEVDVVVDSDNTCFSLKEIMRGATKVFFTNDLSDTSQTNGIL